MQKFQDEINILAGPRLALPLAAARRVEERARQNQTTGGVGQYVSPLGLPRHIGYRPVKRNNAKGARADRATE